MWYEAIILAQDSEHSKFCKNGCRIWRKCESHPFLVDLQLFTALVLFSLMKVKLHGQGIELRIIRQRMKHDRWSVRQYCFSDKSTLQISIPTPYLFLESFTAGAKIPIFDLIASENGEIYSCHYCHFRPGRNWNFTSGNRIPLIFWTV